ncbi:Uncharacterised protein [Yersinia pseudotuberculosis]|uniref:hypothetical protein n=1 Tax=Yersinia pseudotuberculosis TaxID=633 RepID=UPI000E0883BB|nr:hypothetical protein [Yersinia pseudotuberculosis]SUP87868.1 Uncharacterised protein [Yersinia pseudotuberculosis]
MPERSLMNAMFIQQRIQIMHIALHHGKYTDSYLYAWESGVYPLINDTDGSVPQMPHEPYGEFFTTSKQKVEFLLKRLDDAWLKKERLTFYALEDELGVRGFSSTGWDRGNLLVICKYLYLDGCFDDDFWKTLTTNGECPSEAHSIIRKFDRTEDIYFM